jgi:BASS family bile acid:Na+ symporter
MASLIPLVLQASIILTVFAIGLSNRARDVLQIARTPGLLLRSLVSINILMPLFAALMAAAFALMPAVEIALIALAVSPIPPLLPKKAIKAGGDASFAIGLLAAAALLAIAFVPVSVHVLGIAFGKPAEIPPGQIASIMAANVLAPLCAGLAVSRFAGRLAARIAGPISVIAALLLFACAVPIALNAMPAILSLIGHGTLAAIVAFILFGLAAGHVLGGPVPANRAVLALTTSSRHPGVAAAIAAANFPQEKLAFAAIFLYLLTNVIVSVLYRTWFRRHYNTVPDS